MIDQEDTTAKLIGFTVTGGRGTVWTDARQKAQYREGGGVLCELGSPVIEHNVIEGNRAVEVGPGILSAGGGGIRCGYAEPIIRHNVIRNNRGEYGGGVVLYHSAGTVQNNLIAGNSGGAGHGGSGLWVVGALSYRLRNLIEQNTIVGNVAVLPDSTPTQLGGKGGAMIAFAPILFRNNVVWGNRSGVGGQIEHSKRLPPELKANLVQDGAEPGADLTTDPAFADTLHYYLSPGSPAVDRGDLRLAVRPRRERPCPSAGAWQTPRGPRRVWRAGKCRVVALAFIPSAARDLARTFPETREGPRCLRKVPRCARDDRSLGMTDRSG
jgi:hypothetical protein